MSAAYTVQGFQTGARGVKKKKERRKVYQEQGVCKACTRLELLGLSSSKEAGRGLAQARLPNSGEMLQEFTGKGAKMQ